jgi:predicted acyl esterase
VVAVLMVMSAAPAFASARTRVPDRVKLPAQVPGTTADASHDYSATEGLSQPTFDEIETLTFEVPSNVAGAVGQDAINIYVEVTKPKAEGNYPVILEASPYHGPNGDRKGTRIFPDPVDEAGNKIGLTGYFAPRGYAVVMMDLRGTGRSEGCLDHLGAKDAADMKTVIEWAASQEWSNGRVGMTGHSYVAGTQVAAAAQKPQGLVTIVPSAGLGSMYDHQFQLGVPYMLQWAGPIFAYELLAMSRHLPPGIPDPSGLLGSNGTGDNFGNDMQYFGCGWQNSALVHGDGNYTGQYKQWHAERDWTEAVQESDIPVFMVHGAQDNAARIPAAEWFFGDRTPNPADKVWLGQWTHGANVSTSVCGVVHVNCRRGQWTGALHAWFDKHLAQTDVDTGPAVEVFLNDDLVYEADTWNKTNDPVTLYPTGSNTLATEPAAAATKSFQGQVMRSNSNYVDFTSAPFTEETVISGLPTMNLSASTVGNVHLAAYLYEKDGSTGQIRTGTPISICTIAPLLRNGKDQLAPIVPRQKMALKPQCWTSARHLEIDDQLVLRVGTPGNPLTTGFHHVPISAVDPEITVFTGPGETSITLPTITGATLVEDVLVQS